MSSKILLIFDLTKTLAFAIKNSKETFHNALDQLQKI